MGEKVFKKSISKTIIQIIMMRKIYETCWWKYHNSWFSDWLSKRIKIVKLKHIQYSNIYMQGDHEPGKEPGDIVIQLEEKVSEYL